MLDPHASEAWNNDPELAAQALLYVSGEMSHSESATFERRLAEDQCAREALAQAVPFVRWFDGKEGLHPTGRYRDGVRQRLLPPKSQSPRNYPGHPLLWGGLGAAAALLLVFTLPRIHDPLKTMAPAETSPSDQVATPHQPSAPRPAQNEDMAPDVAEVWAELRTSDHLRIAHEEENRRKARRAEEKRPAPIDERSQRWRDVRPTRKQELP